MELFIGIVIAIALIIIFANVRVVQLNYYKDPKPWITKARGVVTITGTAAYEAALMGKKSIVFGDVPFSLIDGVTRIRSFEDLPAAIRNFGETVRNIRVSEKSAVDPERFLGKNADLRIKEFVERNLNNYSGETTAVLLKIEEERIDLLFDTFGSDFRVESRTDGELTVRVTVNDGWGLTAWLLEHGDCVQIIEPAVIREEVIHYLDLIRKKYADMQDSGKE